MNIPFSYRFSSLAFFFALPWIATAATAQVQMLDKPYRSAQAQAPSPSLAPRFDLPIDAMPSARPVLPVTAPVPVVATLPTWEIQLADGSLSKALMRWSRTHQLPISWEADKDFPAAKASYHGTFFEAFEQVMRDTERSQYPLHACAYDNVVRVLHVSQSCLR